MYKGPRPTPEEFAELKRKRDEALQKDIKTLADRWGFDASKISVHVSGAGEHYCDCPDGPCEHVFEGWVEGETEGGGSWGSTVCSCGLTSMQHSMRFGP